MTVFSIIGWLAALGLGAFVAWLLWRTRDRWPPVPAWDWITILKVGAFSASVLGAGILTLLYWQGSSDRQAMLRDLIARLASGKASAADTLGAIALSLTESSGRDLTILLVGVLFVVLALGWLMTPRKFEAEGLGFRARMEGGDTAGQPTPTAAALDVAGAAVDRAKDIAAQTEGNANG